MEARQRLLNVAARVVGRDGLAAASTRAICTEAGVTAPTLYHHFGSKDGLLAAVTEIAFRKFLARKKARQPSGDPIEDIRRGWDNYVEFAREFPDYYAIMSLPTFASGRTDEEKAAFEILLGLVQAAADAGHLRAGITVRIAAQLLVTASHGIASWYSARREVPLDPLVTSMLRESVLAAISSLPAGGAKA